MNVHAKVGSKAFSDVHASRQVLRGDISQLFNSAIV